MWEVCASSGVLSQAQCWPRVCTTGVNALRGRIGARHVSGSVGEVVAHCPSWQEWSRGDRGGVDARVRLGMWGLRGGRHRRGECPRDPSGMDWGWLLTLGGRDWPVRALPYLLGELAHVLGWSIAAARSGSAADSPPRLRGRGGGGGAYRPVVSGVRPVNPLRIRGESGGGGARCSRHEERAAAAERVNRAGCQRGGFPPVGEQMLA
jgi:hypothetical protein